MPVDPEIAALLQVVEAGTPLYELSVPDARAAFRTLTVDMRPEGSVPQVDRIEDVAVAGAEGPLPARVYRPTGGTEARPTVVYLHGGGFVIGDLDTHDATCRAIARGCDAVVVSVAYRLAPEHPYPAAPQDAISAVRDVRERIADFGGADTLAVAGDSAGGNLTAVVSQHVPGLAAQLLIYPAVDMVDDYPSRTENAEGYFLDIPTMSWFMGHYLPESADIADPMLSPIQVPSTAGVAPALLVTAEFDPLRDEGVAYAERLRADGVSVVEVPCAGMIHGFFDMGPFSQAAQQAIDSAIAQFAELLRG